VTPLGSTRRSRPSVPATLGGYRSTSERSTPLRRSRRADFLYDHVHHHTSVEPVSASSARRDVVTATSSATWWPWNICIAYLASVGASATGASVGASQPGASVGRVGNWRICRRVGNRCTRLRGIPARWPRRTGRARWSWGSAALNLNRAAICGTLGANRLMAVSNSSLGLVGTPSGVTWGTDRR